MGRSDAVSFQQSAASQAGGQTCSLCPSMGMHTEMDVSSSVSSVTQEQGCSHNIPYNIPILYPTCGDQAGCGSASLGPS